MNRTPETGDGRKAFVTAAPSRHEKEAEARAAVASIALREARTANDPFDKRASFELAKVQLLKCLRCLEANLESISA